MRRGIGLPRGGPGRPGRPRTAAPGARAPGAGWYHGPMSQQRAEPDPNRWRVLPVCLAVGFITTLDVSIVNVALPSIESSLDAGPTQLQLVVAGYTLAFGLALVPAGRLGDAGARRPLFIAGLLGFALMSLASGLAPTDPWLGVARLRQRGSAAGK